jgi:putative SOS response-associated peptidase YedK
LRRFLLFSPGERRAQDDGGARGRVCKGLAFTDAPLQAQPVRRRLARKVTGQSEKRGTRATRASIATWCAKARTAAPKAPRMAEGRVEQRETAAGLRSCRWNSLQLLAVSACNARLLLGKRSAQRRKARRRQGWKPEWFETSEAPARWRSHDSPVPAPPGDARPARRRPIELLQLLGQLDQRHPRRWFALVRFKQYDDPMCYSQQVVQDYRRYLRDYGASLSIKEFFDCFYRRKQGEKIVLPKGIEDAFVASNDDSMSGIKALIEDFRASEATRLEEELASQRERLAIAEAKLLVKVTKGASESKRIATDKIANALLKLGDLQRAQPERRDSRIFPGTYALVLVVEDGNPIVYPMRYQCRPAGAPAFYDSKFPGTYNARRDSLNGFWRNQWGHKHGVVITTAFYEHVKRHHNEGRTLRDDEDVEDIVIEFKPQTGEEMLVACLWSRWTKPGEPDLLSFAAITDHPPPEVAIAGHDRCIIPLRPEDLSAWLSPEGRTLEELETILDDRFRPYYEHRLAA